ncbi:MAG: very short patch repair endonuclease [Patescibacteria group bacterium]|jgi:DNA mismatch endonuclease (patch repair protein)
MDIFSPEKRSQVMSRIRSKNTKAELAIRKRLYSLGLRYRVNDRRVIGKPDIVFFKKKIAIFVDGDWWHGRQYSKNKTKYNLFWKQKIGRNIVRDRKVNGVLKNEGWKVIRLWEENIEKDIETAITSIIKVVD